jgi:hypothetical protein
MIDGQPIPLPDRDSITGKTFENIPYISKEEAKYYDDMRSNNFWSVYNLLALVYKLKYRGPRGSVYQQDFTQHSTDLQGPKWKNDFYSTYNNTRNVDVNSTNRVRNKIQLSSSRSITKHTQLDLSKEKP